MPFSMGELCRYCIINMKKQFSRIDTIKKITLQVRIQSPKRKDVISRIRHAKKAFLSASLTLEAAIALTLFIFAVVCLILPMKIMNTDRKIQAALESVGEDFSRYAYIKDVLEKGEAVKIPGAGEFAKAFCGHLAAGAAEGYAQVMVTGHVDTSAVRHVRMLRSSILGDGAMFDLVLDYEIQLPFPVLGLKAVERTARCRRRAWIGITGKDGGDGGGGSGGDSRDETVYVGRYSTRYHRSRSCHYLANNLSAVSYEQAAAMRNKGGGKYYACRVCGAGAGSGSTVYITPYGESYHTTKNCTAIIAYVQAVRLSEVEYMGACSYCSR